MKPPINPMNSTYGSGSLPKPPLARKGQAMTITNDDAMTTTTMAQEQLLLMADHGIEKIKAEIARKKPNLATVNEVPRKGQVQ